MFDAGTTSKDSWLIAASKLAWKIATNNTLLPVRLYNHTNKARAKNSETNLDREDDRRRYQLLDSPAFLGEVVGQVPHRPQQCHIQGELHRAVPVLPVMLQEPGESDLLGKLEEHQLQQKVGCDLGQRSRPATGRRC